MIKFPQSSCDKILNIHVSAPLVGPKIVMKLDVTKELLDGFTADQETRIATARYIFSRDYLVMPVHVSPIICYLILKPWRNKYTDSHNMISMLHQILTIYQLNNKKFGKEMLEFSEQIRLLEEYLHNELDKVYNEFSGNNQKDALDKFIKIMERTTIQRINLYEYTLWKMFKFDNLPLECILTPYITPPLSALSKEEQKGFPKIVCHFFECKQEIRNGLMKEQTKEYNGDVKYFDMKTTRKNEMYNEYLDRMTAWEYFKYLDVNLKIKNE